MLCPLPAACHLQDHKPDLEVAAGRLTADQLLKEDEVFYLSSPEVEGQEGQEGEEPQRLGVSRALGDFDMPGKLIAHHAGKPVAVRGQKKLSVLSVISRAQKETTHCLCPPVWEHPVRQAMLLDAPHRHCCTTCIACSLCFFMHEMEKPQQQTVAGLVVRAPWGAWALACVCGSVQHCTRWRCLACFSV